MIKQEDLPVLRQFIEMLKKPETREISFFDTYEIMYGEPYTNDTKFDIARAEFKRISNILNEHGIAEPETNSFGPLLKPNLKTYDSDIDLIYNELIKSEKQNHKKERKENIDFNMSWIKLYTYWPVLICTVITTFIAVKEYSNNQNTKESLIRLEKKLEEKELELSKLHILFLNQKNQDSSYQTSSDKETSNQKRN